MLSGLEALIIGKVIGSLTSNKFEDLSYLAAIIWMPTGIIGSSAFLFGMSMLACGLGLLATYVRRNRKIGYREINLPRREDDTVEFKTQSNDRDHTKQR